MSVKEIDIISFLDQARLDLENRLLKKRLYGSSEDDGEEIQELRDRIVNIARAVDPLLEQGDSVIKVRYYHMPKEQETQDEEVSDDTPDLNLNGIDRLEKLEAFVEKLEGLVESAKREKPQRELICFTPMAEIQRDKQTPEYGYASTLLKFARNNKKILNESETSSIVAGIGRAIESDFTAVNKHRGIDPEVISKAWKETFSRSVPEMTLAGALYASEKQYLIAESHKKELLKIQKKLSRLRSQPGKMTDERFEKIQHLIKSAENLSGYAKEAAKTADEMLKIASAFKDPKQNPPDPRFDQIADFAEKANQASEEAAETAKQILPGWFAKGVAKASYYLGAGLMFLAAIPAVAIIIGGAPFVVAGLTYKGFQGNLLTKVGAVLGAFLLVAVVMALDVLVTGGSLTLVSGLTITSMALFDPAKKALEKFKKFCDQDIKEFIAKTFTRKKKIKSSVKAKKKSPQKVSADKPGPAKEKELDRSQQLSSSDPSVAKSKVPDKSQQLGATLAAVAQQSEAQQSSSLSAAATKHLTQTGEEPAPVVPKPGADQSRSSSSSKPESSSPSSEMLPMLQQATQGANKGSISTESTVSPEKIQEFLQRIKGNQNFKDCQVTQNNGHLSLSGAVESVCKVAQEWVKTQQVQGKSAIGFKISGNNLDKVKELFEKAQKAEGLSITTVTVGKDTYTADAFRQQFAAKKEQDPTNTLTQPEQDPTKQNPAKSSYPS